MVAYKRILKELIPPILFTIYKRLKKTRPIKNETETWSGNYTSWAEAKSQCTGYDSINILEQCKNSLLKIKNGEAVYERDSVLFDEIQYSWSILAGFLRAALENNSKLGVLDFGGSLGSTYYQNREFLNSIKELKWCIVEQPHFVECGKANFENEQLKFYHSIEECMANDDINVLLLSGVLQYLEKPYDWIKKFIALSIPYIFIDRNAFVDDTVDILTIQHVHQEIYVASYPHLFFNNSDLLNCFLNGGYHKIGHFNSFAEGSGCLPNGKLIYWEGMLFKKNHKDDRKNNP